MNPGHVLDGTVLEARNIPRIRSKLGIVDGAELPPGGTTGQALTKLSDADFDVDWVSGGGIPLHAPTHEDGGIDEIDVTGLSGLLATPQTPASHAASHENAGGDEINVAGLSGLLADPQTPLVHDIITSHNGFPGGGTTFLRDDGTFAVPPGTGAGINELTGDVTAGPGSGSQPATIAADAVTNAKLADMAANTVKVNATAGAANPTDLAMAASTFLARLAAGNIVAATATEATALLNTFTSLLNGLVPASGGGTTTFLRADGTFAVPSITPDSVQVAITAAEDLPAYGPVTSLGLKADSTNPSASFGRVIGIAPAAIANGFSGPVVEIGEITNLAWTWTPGDYIFLSGTSLATTPPDAGFVQRLGTAKSATTIIVDIADAVLL